MGLKRLLYREIVPENTCSGLMCASLGLLPLALAALLFALTKATMLAIGLAGFGVLCVLGGLAVWKRLRWGMLLAAVLHLLYAIAAVGVGVGWDGPISLLAGLFPLCSAAFYYMCFRESDPGATTRSR